MGGWFGLVFFEWTTAWGLHPERALILLLGLILVLCVPYGISIAGALGAESGRHGIYRVCPAGRLDREGQRVTLAGVVKVERLRAGLPLALAWALYFSVLSAFHFGWRDFNVGAWLSRVQPSEFVLRAGGWVRTVAGLQSLVSLYLVAIWALTYFGRPFQ